MSDEEVVFCRGIVSSSHGSLISIKLEGASESETSKSGDAEENEEMTAYSWEILSSNRCLSSLDLTTTFQVGDCVLLKVDTNHIDLGVPPKFRGGFGFPQRKIDNTASGNDVIPEVRIVDVSVIARRNHGVRIEEGMGEIVFIDGNKGDLLADPDARTGRRQRLYFIKAALVMNREEKEEPLSELLKVRQCVRYRRIVQSVGRGIPPAISVTRIGAVIDTVTAEVESYGDDFAIFRSTCSRHKDGETLEPQERVVGTFNCFKVGRVPAGQMPIPEVLRGCKHDLNEQLVMNICRMVPNSEGIKWKVMHLDFTSSIVRRILEFPARRRERDALEAQRQAHPESFKMSGYW